MDKKTKKKTKTVIAATIIAGAALAGLSMQPASAATSRTVVNEGNAGGAATYIAWREGSSLYHSKQECEYWRSVRAEGDEDHHYWCELTDTNTWALMYRISFRP